MNTPIPQRADAASMADMDDFNTLRAAVTSIETICIDEDVWLDDGNKLAMQNIATFLASIAS